MISIIPTPLDVDVGRDTLSIAAGDPVSHNDERLVASVRRFCLDVSRRVGVRLDPVASKVSGGARGVRVELTTSEGGLDSLPESAGLSPRGGGVADERYSLTVSGEGVIVRAFEPIGAARGLTSLLQLLATAAPSPNGSLELGFVRIVDAPRFAWRELSLDLVRMWLTPNEVKRMIDLVALYKFSALHLHLTDDQAWRICAGRPASRQSPDGTFYTDDELGELVAYGEERFVTLIPEVDTPGHARAIMDLRPELDSGRNRVEFDIGGTRYQSAWFDPDCPATFDVIDDVLRGVAAIFPSPWLHIGGDEPFGMPDDLYVRYVRRVCEIVKSVGKRSVGWQESVRAVAERGHPIQYWISALGGGGTALPLEVAANLAKSQVDIATAIANSIPVIVSPASHAYRRALSRSTRRCRARRDAFSSRAEVLSRENRRGQL